MVECPTCAFRNQESDGFCGSCGLFLSWADSAVAVPGSAARGTVATPDRTAAPVIPAGRRGDEAAADPPCPTCRWPNARSRRFCGRCGVSLVRAVPVEPPPLAAVVVPPWWERLMWWRRHRALRVFEAGARPGRRTPRRVRTLDVEGRAAPVRRALRWARATLRRVWPDVVLALLVLGLIAVLFPGARKAAVDANPFRGEPAGFMAPVSCTEPTDQGASLAEYPPAFACDDRSATFFATDIGTRTGRSPRLWVDFAKPVDLSEFHIAVGETSAADVLSSESLQGSGRPSQVCLRFYTSEQDRLTDYLYNDRRDDKATPVATVQIPRADGGAESPDCPRFTGEIADDTEDHRYTFDEVKGVLAVGIEMRAVHPVGPGTRATHVFVSGVEFFGHPAETPPGPAPAPAAPAQRKPGAG